jgi:serine/threonine-protein phosphatase 6 regulatory ankyrin repeat subunit B
MKNNNGRTTLMEASTAGRTEIVQMLLEKGADLDVKDDNGKTALMEASTSGRTEIVQMLLEKGADLDVKDDNGKTALMMVKDENIYFPEVETAIEKIARILRHEAQKRREALFGVALRLGTEKSNTSAARVLGQTVKVNNDEKKLDIHHFANEINKYVGGRKSLKKRRKSIKRY